jgi:hypothetical protein
LRLIRRKRRKTAMRSVLTIILLLATAASGWASERYTRVGRTTDSECPAHLTLEAGFVPNPAFTVSPERALVLSGIRCPSKLEVTVFSDAENYYITVMDAKPGEVRTRVVNGRSGETHVY